MKLKSFLLPIYSDNKVLQKYEKCLWLAVNFIAWLTVVQRNFGKFTEGDGFLSKLRSLIIASELVVIDWLTGKLISSQMIAVYVYEEWNESHHFSTFIVEYSEPFNIFWQSTPSISCYWSPLKITGKLLSIALLQLWKKNGFRFSVMDLSTIYGGLG